MPIQAFGSWRDFFAVLLEPNFPFALGLGALDILFGTIEGFTTLNGAF